MATRATLLPQFLSTAGVVVHDSSRESHFKGFLVLETHHEHLAGLVILCDAGNKSVELREVELGNSLLRSLLV